MKTPAQFAASRHHVEAALAKLRAGEVLPEHDAQSIGRVVEQTLAGYDARTDLGIAPKGGTRPAPGFDAILAAYYWSRRADEPETAVKIIEADIAVAWRVKKATTVRAIADKNRDIARAYMASMTRDQIAEAFRICTVNR